MKNNPFQTHVRKPLKIVPIGTPETGVIYLAKRDGITPNENPVNMQEAMQRQTKATLIFLQAVKNCAQIEGISQAEARERIFPTPKPETEVQSNAETSAIVVAQKNDEPADLYDYLEPDQAVELISLQDDGRNVALQAATLFIQQRLAYPIVVTADVEDGANQLPIEPLRFQVAKGNKFRLQGMILEATEAMGYDSEALILKPLPQAVFVGSVGFLLDMTGREKLGDPNWTIDDTRNYLMENQIEAIYQFYQSEIGMASSEETVTEGNSMTTSPGSPRASTESRSTGGNSTGESKVMASEMNGSMMPTLETSQIG